jgi:CubicO group peptidase (beta-lactamase class C family)
MTSTGFTVQPEQLDRFASCYSLLPTFTGSADRTGAKSYTLTEDAKLTKFALPHEQLNSGGGGLISSIGDVSKFVRMLLNKARCSFFRHNFAFEGFIGSHACSLEALACV